MPLASWAQIFLRQLAAQGHTVLAADLAVREVSGLAGKYEARAIDVTKPETLRGLCDGADAVITTVGLTGSSATITNYDIDYQGNVNLLREAQRAGVKHFTYISVIKADSDPKVPMLHAKAMFEEELKKAASRMLSTAPPAIFTTLPRCSCP